MDEIKCRVQLLGEINSYDIVIIELGGMVGDIEFLFYLELFCQLCWELGIDNCLVIYLILILFLNVVKELKIKFI